MDREWPVWRIVLDHHLPLSEVMKWDLEDVRKFNAFLDMRDAHKEAIDEYEIRETEKTTVNPGG